MNKLEFLSEFLNEAEIDKKYIKYIEKNILKFKYKIPIKQKLQAVRKALSRIHEQMYYINDKVSNGWLLEDLNDYLKLEINIDAENNIKLAPILKKNKSSFKEDFKAILAYNFITALDNVNLDEIWICKNCGRICLPGIHKRDIKYCCSRCRYDHVGDR